LLVRPCFIIILMIMIIVCHISRPGEGLQAKPERVILRWLIYSNTIAAKTFKLHIRI
jgi:hypothetical protein